MSQSISIDVIREKIFIVRGKKVMLDKDLAELYEVPTKQLTRQVRRNLERFPSDFLMQLNREEYDNLRCQFGTSSWGGTRYTPYAFTEQGIAMLSSVLKSPRAIQVNIIIMRVFVQIREMVAVHKELALKLDELERKFSSHDKEIGTIFKVIHKLIAEPEPEPQKPKIGFHTQDK